VGVDAIVVASAQRAEISGIEMKVAAGGDGSRFALAALQLVASVRTCAKSKKILVAGVWRGDDGGGNTVGHGGNPQWPSSLPWWTVQSSRPSEG